MSQENVDGLVPVEASVNSVFYTRPSPGEPAFVEVGDEVDEDLMLEAILEDRNVAKPEDALMASEEKAKALRLLDEIDPREADILRLHYGLAGGPPMSLKEIGKKMGLTRERIRQLRRDALTTLYECMNVD